MPTDEVTNRDRIIYALVAVLLGGGGAVGLRQIDPPRPDPWTSADAHEAHDQLRQEMQGNAATCRANLKILTAELNKHLVRGGAGFQRIEQLETDVDTINRRLNGWR